MKKSLLLSTALIVGVGAFAQTNRRALGGQLYPKAHVASVDITEGTISSTQKIKQSVNGVQSSAIFSNSRNGFGGLVEETNPLHYNQDLNMVAFTQRLPIASSWPTAGLPATGVSGFMVTKYSTDNGTTWAGVSYFQNGTAWSRYPSGVIANPPGNTDPAQAKFVGVGPCTVAATGWDYNWFASVPANSTGNVTNNDQRADSTANSATNSQSRNTYFPSYNTIANGTTVWTGARKTNPADATKFFGVAVFKGVRGATVSDPYTWTQDSTTFGTYQSSSTGTYYCSAPKIAFSPDGMTGYVLVNGILTGATGDNAKSIQPNLWKSTDAGVTWNMVNQNYNWRANHPEMMCNLIPAKHDSDWMGTNDHNESYMAFFDAQGSGITVDNSGKLHYVTTVVPAYSTHPDSAFYIYGQYGFGYTQYEDIDKPWIYDLTTDGTGTWDQHLVGKIFTRNIETTDLVPDPAAWTSDGTAPMDYSNRIDVSRSADGTKIFYTWTDGDTTSLVTGPPDTYHANTYPNFEYRGWDLTTGLFSAQKEMSAFDAAEGGYYNSYTSPIAMPTSLPLITGYRIPAVYISSQDGNLNATNAVDYSYISDMQIDNTEYLQTIAVNTNIVDPTYCVNVVGIKEIAGTSISGVSQNYPNPFNSTSTVNVNLIKSENITLNVMNSIGQVVLSQTVRGNAGYNALTIDAASLTNGMYFYSVTAGNSKVTRKMTIVK